MSDQQYRVIGKSGPGVDWHEGMLVRCYKYVNSDEPFALQGWRLDKGKMLRERWDAGEVEILEAISPPQAAVAACAGWCGLGYADPRVPAKIANSPWHTDVRPDRRGICWRDIDEGGFGKGPSYCTQACLDRAKAAKAPAHSPVMTHGERAALLTRCPVHGGGNCGATCAGRGKAPECIRAACKAPSIAGGELCAAHAGQVETAKTGTAPAARCGHTGPLSCGKCADCTAAPVPAPAETRFERWRREHKGYAHGTMDQRLHDANVAAMMVGIDGPREAYVPPPKLPPWTPRDLDGDIPNAWEPGGARLGGTR